MSKQSVRNHPKLPSNQEFNIRGNKSSKRTWSKVRGHNNIRRSGE